VTSVGVSARDHQRHYIGKRRPPRLCFTCLRPGAAEDTPGVPSFVAVRRLQQGGFPRADDSALDVSFMTG
jgi:hypothetical protein